QLAKDLVQKYCRESSVEVEVISLPMAVASLMNTNYIARELEKRELKGFDLILLPGLVFGDASVVEKVVNIPTFKGPRYAADLPFILNSLDRLKLSKVHPADDLVKNELQKKMFESLREVEENRDTLLKNRRNLEIGNLAVGEDFPIRIMAEIVNVPSLSDEEIQKKALYYVNCGADIIDLGMIAGESYPSDLIRAVKSVRKVVNVPISVDTMDVEEIRAAVSIGVDMVLSIDAGNMEEVSRFGRKVAFVVIPTNFRERYFPKIASERVRMLEENVKRAYELGLNKVIADPILDPVISPGITESIVAYYEFRRRNPDTPLLMGVGNVNELMDAETVGRSEILTGIATELGVGIILTTEVSDKNLGNVQELATASKMMFIAKKNNRIPKGLGIDLLVMRDRKLRDTPFDKSLKEGVKIIDAKEAPKYYGVDTKGYFKVYVDREEKKIIVLHYEHNSNRPSLIIEGSSAESIYRSIVSNGLVSLLDHAAYLGSELQKAEIALKLGKSYIQDSPLY
ncbi:MAG: dihydropteroate synthase-like protein, partial [Nitrososphaerales archaeon]|nr:dihydropteroate synthase-like protein [Nitrososphaerales archaeon]